MALDLKPQKYIVIERAYHRLLEAQDALSAAHVLLQQGDAPEEVVTRVGKTVNRIVRSLDECYTGLMAAAATEGLGDTLKKLVAKIREGEEDPEREGIIEALRDLVASGKVERSSAFAIEIDKEGNVIGEPVAIGEDIAAQEDAPPEDAHEAEVPQGDGEG